MGYLGNDGCCLLPAVAIATPWPSPAGGPDPGGLDEDFILHDAAIESDEPLSDDDERRLWRLLSN